MREQIAALAFVFLLVFSGVGGAMSPTGTAAAAEAGNCSTLDDFLWVITGGYFNQESCSRSAYVNAAVDDMKESDANQTKVDIYQAGSAEVGASQTFGATYDNYLNDTEAQAWMDVQVAVAQAYENGSSKQEAIVAAREAISDYYAVKQVNLHEKWNTSASNIAYLRSTAEMEDGISQPALGSNYGPGDGFVSFDGGTGSYDVVIDSFDNTSTVTLTNGTTRDVRSLRVQMADGGLVTSIHPGFEDGDTEGISAGNSYYDESQNVVHLDDSRSWYFGNVFIKPPNENYDQLTVLSAGDYIDRHRRIERLNSNLQAEAEMFVNATFEDFESGQINASDVISANTAMFEYGVRSGNESEGLWRSTAAIGMMGFDVPNVSTSGTMRITHGSFNVHGLVMAREAPNGTWVNGTTYNTSNIDGPVFIVTTEGEKIDIGENETFTIEEMNARDGSAVEQTETTKVVYKTANTSQLLEMQKQLEQTRQAIEEREPDGTGGGDGPGLLSGQNVLILAAVAGAVPLLGGKD